MRKPPDIPQLIRKKDLRGLERALRFSGDSEIRYKAALGLAKLMNTRAADSLARSSYLDPEETVRYASRSALEELVGKETARNIMDIFDRTHAGEESWLIFENNEENEDPDGTESSPTGFWKTEDIHGLVSVLINERDPRMRLKAIRALRYLHTTQVAETLAGTALWDEQEEVRLAARKVLEEIYGDRLEDVLEFYRDSGEGGTDEEPAETEWPETDSPLARRPFFREPTPLPASPVVQDDNPTWRFLVAGLILLILAAVAFFLFFR